MKNLKPRTYAVTVACVVVLVLASWMVVRSAGDSSVAHAQTVPVSKMQQKLREAQGLLRAITYKDFQEIKAGAGKLSEISFEAQWSESTSPRYDMLSEEFRYNLTNMIAAADAENLEAVTLSYVRVIMNCVACHEEVREGEEIAFLSEPILPPMFRTAWMAD